MRRIIQFCNAIEALCGAPSGILAAQDLPIAYVRGVMW